MEFVTSKSSKLRFTFTYYNKEVMSISMINDKMFLKIFISLDG